MDNAKLKNLWNLREASRGVSWISLLVIVLAAVVSGGVEQTHYLPIAGNTAAAAILLDENFDDGSVTDGVPTSWQPFPGYNNGTFDASSGDFVLTPANDQVSLVTMLDPEVAWKDISIRTQLRNGGVNNANAQATGLLARGIGDRQFVEAGIDVAGLIYVDEVTLSSGRRELGWLSTDLRPLTEDVVLQFDMVGDSLHLFAWRPGEEIPATPQVSVTTRVIQDGAMGIFFNPPDGNGTATFRYVRVHAIPEPSSGVMAALAMCVTAFFRRDRRSTRNPARR